MPLIQVQLKYRRDKNFNKKQKRCLYRSIYGNDPRLEQHKNVHTSYRRPIGACVRACTSTTS